MTNIPAESDLVKPLTNPLFGRPAPIGDIMRQAHRKLVRYLDVALCEAGWPDVNAAHASVLATVDPAGSRLATLVDRGGRTKQATAELASHLVRGEFLGLIPDPTDGRAKLYVLTVRGHDLLSSCALIVDDYERWLDEVVGRDSVALLRRILLQIVADSD